MIGKEVSEAPEHTLEFLLAFDGRRHVYPEGYHLRFEIRRVAPTSERPHGLRYSFTLHDRNGKRLLGFDNAHGVPPTGPGFAGRRMLQTTGTGPRPILGARMRFVMRRP
jgi:hypothetical protein